MQDGLLKRDNPIPVSGPLQVGYSTLAVARAVPLGRRRRGRKELQPVFHRFHQLGDVARINLPAHQREAALRLAGTEIKVGEIDPEGIGAGGAVEKIDLVALVGDGSP
jgi:hypothetical protein